MLLRFSYVRRKHGTVLTIHILLYQYSYTFIFEPEQVTGYNNPWCRIGYMYSQIYWRLHGWDYFPTRNPDGLDPDVYWIGHKYYKYSLMYS